MTTGTITIALDHEWGDGDDDFFEIELEVEFEICGRYRPATWGYYGGEPEEFPEFEVTTVYLEDGSKVPFAWLFGDANWNPPWKLDLEALELECSEKYGPEEPDCN